MSSGAAWVGVALLAVMNVVLGRLVADAFRPPGVTASARPVMIAIGVVCGVAGASIVYAAQGIQLTLAQAGVLSITFLVSEKMASHDYAASPGWEQTINAQAAGVAAVCDRHGWRFGSVPEADALVRAGTVRFDERDYWTLLHWCSREMREIEIAAVQRSGKTPDYHQLCAEKIVALADAWDGVADLPGVVEHFASRSFGEGMDRLDHGAMERARWLAAALRERLAFRGPGSGPGG